MNQNKSDRLVTLPYVIICLSYFVQTFFFSMVSANVAAYAQAIGVAGTLLGTLSGLVSLAALFSRPFSGWICDNFNRRAANLLLLVIFGLVFLGYAFSVNPILLVVVRILHGLTFGVFTTVNMALIGDAVSPKKMVQATTYYGMVTTIANALGPAAGDMLGEKFSFRSMFLAGMVLFFLTALLVRVLQGKQEKKQAEAFSFSVKSMIHVKTIPLAAIGMLNGMVNGAVLGLLLVCAKERSIENASLFFTISAVANVATRPVFAIISDKIHARYLTLPCLLASTLVPVVLAFSGSLLPVIIAGIFNGMGYGAALGFLQGMILMDTEESERGAASSTLYVGLDIGNFVGPTLMSVVVAAFGGSYTIGFLFIAVMPALSILLMLFINAGAKKKEA